jgi:hypothetical protein
MSGHSLEVETAQKAIELADWFVALQMEILTGGQVAARRPELEEALTLLIDTPQGIQASDVYRKRIMPTANEAHALLERMETDGQLLGRSEKPDLRGHITRIYTKSWK